MSWRAATAAFLGLVSVAGPAWGDTPPAEPSRSLFAPPLPRGQSRATLTLRPFFNLLGPGWGAINDVALDHTFARAPFKVTAVAAPLALAVDPQTTGMISHARLGGAFATDFVEVGLSFGGRFRRFGPGGYSLAAGLRLGALDGLSARVDLTYAIVRNYYTGQVVVAMSNLLAAIQVPVHPVATLVLEGGFSFDAWLFATLGLKHHLGPRGAPGTFSVHGGIGVAWLLDRLPCQYADPRPCEGAVWATGPVLVLGVTRVF